VDEDSIITGHLTATDVDGDDITYSLVNEVSGLTLYADGSFTFNASNQHYQS
jgi:VCBS repeat-containing protein